MFQIIYGKKAIKFLKKQDKPTQKCLMTAISRLPLEGDIKKLQGASGYRLRVGNFRVLFDVNGVIIDIIDNIIFFVIISILVIVDRFIKECDYMSNVKERIFGAVTIMSDEDAEKVWNLIQATFLLNNVEEVTPDPDEIAALNAYHSGDPDYQPAMSQEEVLKELGL